MVLYNNIRGFVTYKWSYFLTFLWWILEATVFFIIPDVLLGFLWVFRHKNKLGVFFSTILWSILGWVILYLLTYYGMIGVSWLSSIPLINDRMINKVLLDLDSWYLPFIISTLWWIPYKIQAVAYGMSGINIFIFVILSFISRAPRFIFSLWLSHLIWESFKDYFEDHARYLLLIYTLVWIIIYMIYYLAITSTYY